MTDLGHNPRYANWARWNGRTPEAQLEQDKKDWPGGSMVGFTQWNTGMIKVFSHVKPGATLDGHLIDHAAYDEWLTLQVDAVLNPRRGP